MSAREYCVYNETRENTLMPRVTVLDTRAEPLKAVKVLIEGLEPGSEKGMWLHPLKSVPTIPRLSGYDLVYLDPQCRVLQAVALGADDDIPRIDGETASALVLPIHTFSASFTHLGDKVVLHAAEEPAPAPVERTSPPAHALPEVPTFALATLTETSAADAAELPLQLPEPELLPPTPTPKGISLLRSIVQLRIHISISITTSAPTAVPPIARPNTTSLVSAEPALRLLRARVASLAQGCTETVHAAAASTQTFLREHSRSCIEGCAILKRRYARWAEVFVYGAPRVNTRSSRRQVRRSPRLEEEC